MTMSKFFFHFFFTFLKAEAQLKIPALSPAAMVEEQVGLAKATVAYSRPSLRGRKMLGEAYIPFGKVWRMGANTVTTLKLDDDVLIEEKMLAKGIVLEILFCSKFVVLRPFVTRKINYVKNKVNNHQFSAQSYGLFAQ
jgi:hypothetical protein